MAAWLLTALSLSTVYVTVKRNDKWDIAFTDNSLFLTNNCFEVNMAATQYNS